MKPMKIGDIFGRLTVLSFHSNLSPKVKFCLCKCSCGTTLEIRYHSVLDGNTQSCGCLHRELISKQMKTHGDSKTRLYGIYAGIRKRIFYEKDREFKNYGGRGITLCKSWLKYENFKKWAVSNGYRDDLTIERRNFNGNYCPQNCTWIPTGQQGLNRRGLILYKGETQKQAGIRLGGSPTLVRDRIRLGWTKKKAYETPAA